MQQVIRPQSLRETPCVTAVVGRLECVPVISAVRCKAQPRTTADEDVVKWVFWAPLVHDVERKEFFSLGRDAQSAWEGVLGAGHTAPVG